MLLPAMLLAATACGIKTQVKVPISPRIAAAKTATLQELLAMLRDYSDKITSLSSSSVKVSLTVARAENTNVQENRYRAAPGYILMKRPDNIRLNILNPITKTTIIELLSVGDGFEIWSPRDNKFYVGRNSAKEFELDANSQAPAFSARPIHIFKAIFPQSLLVGRSDQRIACTQEQDAEAKYYVLTILQQTGDIELKVLRKLWIERSQMAVVKEEAFSESGEVASVVTYSELFKEGEVLLPHLIHIDRPMDGYKLDLRFANWHINPDLDETSFAMVPPPGAERVVLKEKRRSIN